MIDKPNHKKNECPACLYVMDSVPELGGGDHQPRPFDFSICLNCGALLRFDETMDLRLALEDEEFEIHPEQLEQVYKAQRIIRKRGFIHGHNRSSRSR